MNKEIPILMYHSIAKSLKGDKMRGLSVPPNLFARHMSILRFLGYQGLSLEKLEPYLTGKKSGKVIGITFDDGYQDNYISALPILKRYGFSSTCFLVPNLIGKTNSWDVKYGIREKKLMTYDDIDIWIKSGMEIGSHTLNHIKLSKCADEDLNNEILLSKRNLEKIFGVSIKSFCYPYGDFNQKVKEKVIEYGYTMATTTYRGHASCSRDMFSLPRVLITHRTYSHLLLLKLLTKYEEKRNRDNYS